MTGERAMIVLVVPVCSEIRLRCRCHDSVLAASQERVTDHSESHERKGGVPWPVTLHIERGGCNVTS
jgi:hypothetical protein